MKEDSRPRTTVTPDGRIHTKYGIESLLLQFGKSSLRVIAFLFQETKHPNLFCWSWLAHPAIPPKARLMADVCVGVCCRGRMPSSSAVAMKSVAANASDVKDRYLVLIPGESIAYPCNGCCNRCRLAPTSATR